MTVIVHKNKSIKNIKTLSEELAEMHNENFPDNPYDPTSEDSRVVRDAYIRMSLQSDKKYDAWEYLTYYGYKNGVTLKAKTALVSLRGQIAYDLDDGMHVSSGEPKEGYLQVSIPVIGHDTPIGVARAVASTFLPLPGNCRDISPHDLEVVHIDGKTHQAHFANLEWRLNESAPVENKVEVTVTAQPAADKSA